MFSDGALEHALEPLYYVPSLCWPGDRALNTSRGMSIFGYNNDNDLYLYTIIISSLQLVASCVKQQEKMRSARGVNINSLGLKGSRLSQTRVLLFVRCYGYPFMILYNKLFVAFL